MVERLRVSENKRRLLHEDGSPFFYLGDTAWQLFNYLSLEDADHYLTFRARQKFNVIQAVALFELDGLQTPNRNGDVALQEMDPTRPNEAYFAHIDRVIELGAQKGLWWGLLPTWGDKWNLRWGRGPEIFDPENARVYGECLGKRYRNAPIIWMMGGDRPVESDRHLQIIRAMAEGVRAGDGGAHLITFHPHGGASSTQSVSKEAWLDLNTLQSGHQTSRLNNHWEIKHDYHSQPVKPCLDSEPVYENHPEIGFRRDLPAPYFDDRMTRRAAYQAVFAGACGHTYGCHDIWQFWDGVRPSVNRSRTPWKEALLLPGAAQMQFLRELMESLPFEHLLPDDHLASVLPSGEPVQALRTDDRTIAVIYFPTAGARTVQLAALAGESFAIRWFDPGSGGSRDGGTIATGAYCEFTSPFAAQDSVLILRQT